MPHLPADCGAAKSIVGFYLEDFMLDEDFCFLRAELSIAGPAIEACLAVEMHLGLAALRAGNGLMFRIAHLLSGLLLTTKCLISGQDALSAIPAGVLRMNHWTTPWGIPAGAPPHPIFDSKPQVPPSKNKKVEKNLYPLPHKDLRQHANPKFRKFSNPLCRLLQL